MLIGKTITIISAKNKSIEGKKGTVIDETKNTITITDKIKTNNTINKTNKTNSADKTIIKEQITTITEEQS